MGLCNSRDAVWSTPHRHARAAVDPMRLHLLDLPVDVLELVLSHLELKDILALRATCMSVLYLLAHAVHVLRQIAPKMIYRQC